MALEMLPNEPDLIDLSSDFMTDESDDSGNLLRLDRSPHINGSGDLLRFTPPSSAFFAVLQGSQDLEPKIPTTLSKGLNSTPREISTSSRSSNDGSRVSLASALSSTRSSSLRYAGQSRASYTKDPASSEWQQLFATEIGAFETKKQREQKKLDSLTADLEALEIKVEEVRMKIERQEKIVQENPEEAEEIEERLARTLSSFSCMSWDRDSPTTVAPRTLNLVDLADSKHEQSSSTDSLCVSQT